MLNKLKTQLSLLGEMIRDYKKLETIGFKTEEELLPVYNAFQSCLFWLIIGYRWF